MVINRSSLVPPYQQVAAILLERITSGQYKPGALIPSESEMMENFGVSRDAVGHAVHELRYEDWLVPVAGRGTYVAHPLPEPGER